MIVWEAFEYQGITYDLSHLHSSRVKYIQPRKAANPERTYKVEVHYSLYCFSKALTPSADPLLNYSDARETRTFDIERYELSKRLPQIIQGMNSKWCMHTRHGKFFVVEPIILNNVQENYDVFFNVTRSTTKGVASIFVQSAYVRDSMHSNRLFLTKKISLYVILNNKLIGKPIRVQH